jgi:hypothetical protein
LQKQQVSAVIRGLAAAARVFRAGQAPGRCAIGDKVAGCTESLGIAAR